MGFIRILAVSVLLASTAYAEKKQFTITPQIGVYSDYMVKGKNEFDGTSIQPSIIAGYHMDKLGSLGAKVWAHFSGEGGDRTQEDFTEIDYTLSYSNKIGPISAAAGYTFRTFPDHYKDRETQDVIFTSLAAKKVPLKPYLSYYHDFEKDYDYIELTLSHSYQVLDNLKITPFFALGYVENADGKTYKDDGFAHHSYGLAFDTYFEKVFVSPSINVTRELDRGADNEVWFGTNIGMKF